jgi:hypothetical protein
VLIVRKYIIYFRLNKYYYLLEGDFRAYCSFYLSIINSIMKSQCFFLLVID